MAVHPAQIRHLVDRAMRIAKAERTVTCIIIPNDLQEVKAVKVPEHFHGTQFIPGVGHVKRHEFIPDEKDLQQRGENSERRPACRHVDRGRRDARGQRSC